MVGICGVVKQVILVVMVITMAMVAMETIEMRKILDHGYHWPLYSQAAEGKVMVICQRVWDKPTQNRGLYSHYKPGDEPLLSPQ